MNATTAPRRRPPEQKADTRQQADMRTQLHAAIDRIIDHYPHIAAEADNRGWPTNLRQDEPRRGGALLTSVEAAADHHLFPHGHPPKPGEQLTLTPDEWLLEFKELRSMVINVDARAQILDPPKASRLGRENTMEICTLCDQPIGETTQQGKPALRRIDGNPYHATSCYYRVRRATP